MVVQCAFFVNRLSHNTTVGNDCHCPAAHFQSVQTAVLLGPFGESEVVQYV